MDNAKGKMSKSSVPLGGWCGCGCGWELGWPTRIRGWIDCEWAEGVVLRKHSSKNCCNKWPEIECCRKVKLISGQCIHMLEFASDTQGSGKILQRPTTLPIRTVDHVIERHSMPSPSKRNAKPSGQILWLGCLPARVQQFLVLTYFPTSEPISL